MERNKIKLSEFISVVQSNKNIDYDLILDCSEDESKLLEKFCSYYVNTSKYQEAWSIILDAIAENLYPNDMTYLFTSNTLEFLIQNDICVNDLGHLQLKDKWLKKIYKKDNQCIEALETIIQRRSKNK